jgi:hypothetical protein
MRNPLLLLVFTIALSACAPDGSSTPTPQWSPVDTPTNCDALNTLGTGTFEFTSPDGVAYLISNGQVTMPGTPGVDLNGVLPYGNCSIDVNHGAFVSSTWN